MSPVQLYPKFFLGTLASLSFFYLLYLPLLQQPTFVSHPPDVIGWEANKSRNTSLYVRPQEYTTLLIGEAVCPRTQLDLLIVVCSGVQNFSMRAAIRSTWARDPPPRTTVMFFVGTYENRTVQEYVEEEKRLYEDIVQEDFVDSYNNLTIKSIMMLKFIRQMCAHAKYIAKTDDDIFFDVKKLFDLIQEPKFQDPKYGLMGNVLKHAKPIRSAARKWYTPEYMYSDDFYPTYLSGVAYLMSFKVAQSLYDESLRIPLLHHEDVFITGMCAKAAGITPVHLPGFDNVVLSDLIRFDVCHTPYIVVHRVNAAQLIQLWAPIRNHECNQSSPFFLPSFFNRLTRVIR